MATKKKTKKKKAGTGLIGRPAFAITAAVLKKLERFGASGVTQKWAAMGLMMSVDTFVMRCRDNSAFSDAWERGKAKWAALVMADAPVVYKGLIKNAKEGNVTAQLGFMEKVLRRPDEGQTGIIDLDGIGPGQGQEARGPVEIEEVRFRRIRQGKGRIEDDSGPFNP